MIRVELACPVVIVDSDDIRSQVEELIGMLTQRIRRLVDILLGWARRLPGVGQALVTLARRITETFAMAVQRLDEVRGLFSGRPKVIWDAARSWDAFADALDDLAQQVRVDNVESLDDWAGTAADRYSDTIGGQHDELLAKARIAQVSGGLRGLAQAIAAVWAGFAVYLLAVVAEAAAAIIAASTGAGAPAAALIVVGMLLQLLVALAGFTGAVALGAMQYKSAAEEARPAVDDWQPVATRRYDDLHNDGWHTLPADPGDQTN